MRDKEQLIEDGDVFSNDDTIHTSRYRLKKRKRHKQLLRMCSGSVLIFSIIAFTFIFTFSGLDSDEQVQENVENQETEEVTADQEDVKSMVIDSNQSEGNSGEDESDDIREYEVEKGDTLYSISVRHYDSADYQSSLADYNEIDDKNSLKIGDVIKIPPVTELRKDMNR
jgi:LysM repeat protein